MKINDKINLLLRMQLCSMPLIGQCDGCPFRTDGGEGCQASLAKAAMKALTEGEDPAEEKMRVEDIVADILIDIGCPASGEGYPQLIEGICYLVYNPEAVNKATKDLYRHVGEVFNSTGSRTERNMRNCIENAFSRCDHETVERYFGNSINPDKGKPTTSEFIARIADIARRKAWRADHG